VIGLRGQAAIFAFTYLQCITASHESFDAMLDAMPAHLAEADANVPENLVVHAAGMPGVELVAVGWSGRKAGILGRRFVKRGDMREFAIDDFDLHISPWDSEAMAGLQVKKPGALQRIAEAQVSWMRSMFGATCGGKLLVCNVTRRSMTICQKAEL
jgi:hypothetical protein